MVSRKPNILFFFPDQHRSDWLGNNLELPLKTPNLNHLMECGVNFTQAFTPSPLCAPARASLASGKDYPRCGVANNQQNYPIDQPTYYQALHAAGYRVAGVGKFDLHKGDLDWNLDGSRLLPEWGFTEGIDNEGKLDGSISYNRNNGQSSGPYLTYLQNRGLAAPYAQEHNPDFLKQQMGAYTTCLPDDAYCDNWLSENGLQILRAFPQDTPWHLVVNFTGPHDPMEVTQSMRERWAGIEFPAPHQNDHPDRAALQRNRQNYAAMIENIDRQVGRFLELVKERGELENTIVVYSSDHGEMLGDHKRWGKNIWYTPSTRIPLIVAGPGVSAAVSSPALVSLHDLAATFLDYAGAAPLPAMDAISLKPLLEGQVAGHREVVFSGLGDWRMVLDSRYKLVRQSGQLPILFDLENDPLEDRNIAQQHPGVVAQLSQVIDEFWQKSP